MKIGGIAFDATLNVLRVGDVVQVGAGVGREADSRFGASWLRVWVAAGQDAMMLC